MYGFSWDLAPCLYIYYKRSLLIFCLVGPLTNPFISYNSVVFASISTSFYKVISVNQAFLDAKSVSNFTDPDSYLWDGTAEYLHGYASSGALERLENSECIQAYAKNYVTDRGDLLLVAKPDPANISLVPTIYNVDHIHPTILTFSYYCRVDVYQWLCSEANCQNPCQPQVPALLQNANNWRPFNDRGHVNIDHCLSQKTPEHCKLQFSVDLAILVLVMNFLKLVLMVYTATGLIDAPLVTTGDAVASFLEKEDPTTRNMCLVSASEIKGSDRTSLCRDKVFDLTSPREWKDTKFRYGSVVSGKRWTFSLLL